MQAMILAAGFGSRLLPYSLIRPKPLFPILNRPLLSAIIERLRAAGCGRIVVNCHYLAEQIIAAVAGIDDLVVQHEPVLLGTGGSLAEVLPRIADEPLLVVNGDIYHTIDFRLLYKDHLRRGEKVTLALHDYPRFGKVTLNGDRISGFSAPLGSPGALAYTGVQVVSPEMIETIGSSRPYCIIDHYRSLIEAGVRIGYRVVRNGHWTDIGTVGDYLRLHGDLLADIVPCWSELRSPQRKTVLIDSEACCDPTCRFDAWACIGAARIGERSVICRSVVWDGAVVAPGEVVTDRLIVPGGIY